LVVGHSAGAAIGLRMVAEGGTAPGAVVSINGALRQLQGASTVLFPAAARLLAATPVTPFLFSLQASGRGMVDRLLAGTGSRVDPIDAAFYARLLGRPGHVAGALRMMSRWDLAELGLDRVRVPVTLLAGSADRMIPPGDASVVAARLARARVVALPGLGHLAHEEDPALVGRLIAEAMAPVDRRAVA
jgi:magnesium chelatase accessory protein